MPPPFATCGQPLRTQRPERIRTVAQSWQREYDGYLFDLDGTLVDTAPDLAAALNYCMTQLDLTPVDISLTRHWVGHGARMLISQALNHHGISDEQTIDRMLPVFLDHYGENLAEHSEIYPGVTATLAALQERGARLAVVTNKMAKLSEPLLEQIGLTQYFDLIVCGDTASAPKPDPAPIFYCLARLELTATQALFVGDSNTDVLAANGAGMPVICVRDGYNHGVDVTTLAVDGVIDRFNELLDSPNQ